MAGYPLFNPESMPLCLGLARVHNIRITCMSLPHSGIVSANSKTSLAQANLADYATDLEDLTIRYCACKPVAEQLLVRGLFGCAPIQPSMAFGMDLLELVSTTMLYIAPKVSGWSSSLEWFWKERGYVLGPKVRDLYDMSLCTALS